MKPIQDATIDSRFSQMFRSTDSSLLQRTQTMECTPVYDRPLEFQEENNLNQIVNTFTKS